MYSLPSSIQKLIDEFEKLPGVGPKSAARMAYHYLRAPKEEAEEVAKALVDMKEKVHFCNNCYNLSENEVCEICSSKERDGHVICVVEESLDVFAFEQTRSFSGKYFVLGGLISPVEGIGPEELRINEFVTRIRKDLIDLKELELLFAFNPTMEGEATVAYLKKTFEEEGLLGPTIKITRLARGLPTGADLKYADYSTLRRALEGRVEISS